MRRIWVMCGMVIGFASIGCKRESQAETEKKENENKGAILTIEQKHFSVPSPLQVMRVISSPRAQFIEDLLLSPEKAVAAQTNFTRALYLGMYVADFAYCVSFNQTNKAIVIMSSIKRLMEETGITELLTPEVMKEMEKHVGNKDSLLAIAGKVLKDADIYLRENKLEERGAVIMAGGWLKSLLFAVNVYEQTKDSSILRFLADQAYTYDNIATLLEKYSGMDPEIGQLGSDIRKMENIFGGIKRQIHALNIRADNTRRFTEVTVSSSVEVSPQFISEAKKMLEEIIYTRTEI